MITLLIPELLIENTIAVESPIRDVKISFELFNINVSRVLLDIEKVWQTPICQS